ncbi:MAG: FliI/YscN family ATPase [Pseudomonadota bacterium]
MASTLIDHLRAVLARERNVRRVGRIAGVSGGRLEIAGLSDTAALGDRVAFHASARSGGEVVELNESRVVVLPEASPEGFAVGQEVFHDGPIRLSPDDSWIGRVIDPMGYPLDGQAIVNGRFARPLMPDPGNPTDRRGLGRRVTTGLSLFDTLLPIVRGQRLGLFAGSGVGKSTLLARLAEGVEADIVVVALIGERGREVREFVEKVLGPSGMERAVVVAATADRSPLLRRRCAYAAMAVAEHFRDGGKHVLFLADSITRFAEAHREVALASGEGAAMRGFPPSTAQRIMALAERAGPGSAEQSDITALFSVLVAGSDMEEPIADILRGVLDGHIVLDRAIAERGRFPAVDVARSVSRALPEAASPEENAIIAEARAVLGVFERSELMIRAGLYSKGGDPELDRAVATWPALDSFFATRSSGSPEESFKTLAELLLSGASQVVAQIAADAEHSAALGSE